MKRLFFLYVLFLYVGVSSAQTQQGVVKTPTRRNVDGTMTQGRYVSNAIIGVQLENSNVEQTYLSDGQGKFAFLAPSSYFVTSVVAQKGSYTFVDADFVKKQRRYSSNVVEILVDDPNVLAKVREEAIAHERRKIRDQIRAKEDEIEALKEANKLTIAEYNKMIGELSEYRKNSESIVHQIAEVYAATDFDSMDDFNRSLLAFIEDGNFTSADSLLQTQNSKEQEFARIREADSAIRKTKEEIQVAEEYNLKDKESFARRLYSEHLMYLQRPLMQDSALYCMKMRADLDTTNTEAVWEYASLCYKQSKFTDCEKYFLICFRSFASSKDISNLAMAQNNLGLLYLRLNNHAYSERYLRQALENQIKLFQQNSDAYRAGLASIQTNLGILYFNLNENADSERYMKQALENREILFQQNPDAYRGDLAAVPNNLGLLYFKLHDYASAEKYMKLALDNAEQLFCQNPDAYQADIANIQNNLGMLYSNLYDYANSEKYLKKALENHKILFQQNPNAYRSDLAKTQINLGTLYSKLHNYANAEKYMKQALENQEILFQQNPDAYRGDLATVQNNLGKVYSDLHDFASGEKYYKLSLVNREHLFRQNQEAYRADLAVVQNNLGRLYSNLHDYANSEKYLKQALENQEILFQQNPDAYRGDLATVQHNLGMLYSNLHDYANSEKYLKQALENQEILFQQNPDEYRANIASIHSNLGKLYFDLQDFMRSVEYYKLSLEDYEQLFNQTPNVYREGLTVTQSVLGSLYLVLQDHVNSEKYLRLTLENSEFLFRQAPETYRVYLKSTYSLLMQLYADLNEMEQYEYFLEKSLTLVTDLYMSQPSIYINELIELRNRKVYRLLINGNGDEALTLALENFDMDKNNETTNEYLAECYYLQAYEFAKSSDFANAYNSIDKAILISPKNAKFYNTKGEILLMQGKTEDALKMWEKVVELNPVLLDNHPEGTELSNGLMKLGLIENKNSITL